MLIHRLGYPPSSPSSSTHAFHSVSLTKHNEKHTSADASGGPVAGPEVALQPLGMVARLRLAAVFVQLSGTHFAAAAAIRDQTDSRRAFGKLLWARAYRWAAGEDLSRKTKDFQVTFTT